MRGRKSDQPQLFYTIDVESRIRPNHPLRALKLRIDAILENMDDVFSKAYGRILIPS